MVSQRVYALALGYEDPDDRQSEPRQLTATKRSSRIKMPSKGCSSTCFCKAIIARRGSSHPSSTDGPSSEGESRQARAATANSKHQIAPKTIRRTT